jgi:hypothetical protein
MARFLQQIIEPGGLMKVVSLLICIILMSACSKSTSTPASEAALATPNSQADTKPQFINGEWDNSAQHTDSRVGRIDTATKYVFQNDGQYSIEYDSYYETVNVSYVRHESGIYQILGDQIHFKVIKSTCPSGLPATMQLVADSTMTQIEFRFTVPGGTSSIYLSEGFRALERSQAIEDQSCSHFY